MSRPRLYRRPRTSTAIRFDAAVYEALHETADELAVSVNWPCLQADRGRVGADGPDELDDGAEDTVIHRFESKFQRVPKGEHPGALAHPEIAYTGDWEDFSECWAEPADEGESWLWVRRARDGHRIVTVVKADPADVPRVEREVA